jgi:hypothetical protein
MSFLRAKLGGRAPDAPGYDLLGGMRRAAARVSAFRQASRFGGDEAQRRVTPVK